MLSEKVLEQSKATLIALSLQLAALVPFRVAQWLGRMIGLYNWLLHTRAAQVTEVNVTVCLPEMDERARQQLTKSSLMETGKTMMETASIWMGSIERNLRRIRKVSGEDILTEALSQKRGVILILPHLGNWELFNLFYGARGTMTALYQPPREEALHNLIRKVRNRGGNRMVPPTRKGLAQLYRTLAQGGVVTILPDQVPATGTYANFFGVQALTDMLIPRLVKRTGARVVCVYVKRLTGGTGFEVVFRPSHPDIDSSDMKVSVNGVNASIEACVREIPEQYQWEYKRFRERPKGEPKLYQFRKGPPEEMRHQ
ncbi:MAG: lysophospholipid acyltransferase family protein [Pseudomonadales bacterium]|mgnify:CR=1 FL=1|nr:lysophospholipid acyltransferase family protein [Pseudomonadales bacterium]MDP7146916.1 lysophospholipid acyltransferase family protein [Pseudomonadales bacterium]MDP7360920.1 lysophospholipid acyltransferase family protein [Pseudomonadales bacterium]HJN52071.1 lysophospholipid acyltransferase family protein [Pseudomonadales bacterium]